MTFCPRDEARVGFHHPFRGPRRKPAAETGWQARCVAFSLDNSLDFRQFSEISGPREPVLRLFPQHRFSLVDWRAMTVPILDLQAQYRTLRPEIEAAVREVLESGQFVLGPNVAALEQELADTDSSDSRVHPHSQRR